MALLPCLMFDVCVLSCFRQSGAWVLSAGYRRNQASLALQLHSIATRLHSAGDDANIPLTRTCCDLARCVFFSQPALVVNRIARFSSQPGVLTGMQDILQRMLTQCQARLHVPEDHSELQVRSQLQQDQGLGPGHSIGGSHAFAAANSISTRIVDYRDDCRLVGRELTARAIAQAKEDEFAFSVFDGF